MDWEPVKNIPKVPSIHALVVHEQMFDSLKDNFPTLEEVEENGATYLVENMPSGRKYRFVKSELL